MKRALLLPMTFIAVLVAAFLMMPSRSLTASPAHADTKTYAVDAGHSAVLFRIKHLRVSNFYGRFNGIKGEYTLDAHDPTKNRFSFEVDADSVDTNSPDREKHIKSKQLFDVKSYPTITFESTKVAEAGNGKFNVTGNLTFHGVTKEITVPMKLIGTGSDPWGGFRSGIETRFTIKRGEYGMSELSGPLGEEVTLMVAIEGIEKK